ncbi:MAG: hypothetical protein RI953_937 [Pseudomonadota bacterium]
MTKTLKKRPSRSNFHFLITACALIGLLSKPMMSFAQPTISSATQDFLERDDLVVRFTPQGGCIKDLQVKNFKEKLDGEDNARVTGGHVHCRALAIKVGQEDLRNSPAEIAVSGQGSATIVQKSGPIEVTRTLQLREPYSGEFSIVVKNNGNGTWSGPVGVDVGLVSEPKDAGGLFGGPSLEYREAVYYVDEKVTRVTLPFEEKTTPSVLEEKSSFKPEWIASNSLYFALALLPKGGELFDVKVARTGFNSGLSAGALDRTLYELWLSTMVNDLAPGSSKTINFDLYAGPKSKSALSNSFKSKNLSKNIDFGFFSVVAWPLFYVLKWFETISKNWGLAIILLTVVLKIVLYPLTEKAFVAGKKMQKLQPELNALKEKFKDDKQAQQREMMSLMGQRGVNPMSGCLPILPQLPIFFGLNAVLMHTFELRHAPFAFWLKDMTARDPLYITPVIMAGLMYIQQKLTPAPTSMDPAQQKMMQFLPLIFAVFMLTYPSGLVVYIITNTVLSLIQQKYMMRKYASLN